MMRDFSKKNYAQNNYNSDNNKKILNNLMRNVQGVLKALFRARIKRPQSSLLNFLKGWAFDTAAKAERSSMGSSLVF